MQKSLEILAVSMRVLTAINNRQLPAQSDIDMVTALAGPRPGGMGLDEFICDVIRAATEQRATARNPQESPAQMLDAGGWSSVW
jgi:hypothetical protein